MPHNDVQVHWQMATDERFRHIIRRGTVMASPRLAHSVHVDVRRLRPATPYWYRFKVGSHISHAGRTRTAPAPGASPKRLGLAFVSCQNWQHGYYAAYRNLAEEDVDLVVHLGDYIYESGVIPGAPRAHDGPEPVTLEQYRNRHALYKTDPDLRRAHAAFPFVATFDDHETENNYAGSVPQAGSDSESRGAFRARRAAAYRAYWEHMPLRRSSRPAGPDMLLYRRLVFGDLMELMVLDTRQYRSAQPCTAGVTEGCAVPGDQDLTMTGPNQERWLFDALDHSRGRWNVIAQQTMLAQFDLQTGRGRSFSSDQWDGYPAARQRILQFLSERRPSNPVVISGDLHSSWVAELKTDFRDPKSRTVGTEFVGTSISSLSPAEFNAAVATALPDNPHVSFFDGQYRGYTRCEVTRDRWRTDMRAVSDVLSADARAFTLASFDIENGRPGTHSRRQALPVAVAPRG